MSETTIDTPDTNEQRRNDEATLAAALHKAQGLVKTQQNTAYNEFSKSKYVPVDEMVREQRKVLQDAGLAFAAHGQRLTNEGKAVAVTWCLAHKGGATRYWVSEWPINKNTGLAGTLSEAIKYELRGLLMVDRSDDLEAGEGDARGGNAPRVPRPDRRPQGKLGPEGESALEEALGSVNSSVDELRKALVAGGLELVAVKGKPRDWPVSVKDSIRDFIASHSG